jgi:hypothetical protein
LHLEFVGITKHEIARHGDLAAPTMREKTRAGAAASDCRHSKALRNAWLVVTRDEDA